MNFCKFDLLFIGKIFMGRIYPAKIATNKVSCIRHFKNGHLHVKDLYLCVK